MDETRRLFAKDDVARDIAASEADDDTPPQIDRARTLLASCLMALFLAPLAGQPARAARRCHL